MRGAHPVEALGLVEQGGNAARTHIVDQLGRHVAGTRDIGQCARHRGEQFGRAEPGSSEVNGLDHRNQPIRQQSTPGIRLILKESAASE